MQLLFLSQWLTGEVLKVICWTLVHSIWEGLLAAALAGIIIVSTKKSSARLRYNLLGMLLALFLFTVGATLYQQWGRIEGGISLSNTGVIEDNAVFTGLGDHPDQVAVSATGPVDVFTGFLNRNAGLIMLLWTIFFLVNCIKIFAGLAGVHRLRTYKVQAAGEWQTKLNYLTEMIGIYHSVRLLQSELIKVPVVIGFFKPVILVPLGLLSHLPPDQVETILLHELAHIRRRDYLVNILQRFTEAIFFFNPALLWISSLIRQEREACCDDIVVANTHHKGSYLEALVSFQEYSVTGPGYAMGISSKKHYLLNRVRRMLTRENKKLDLMEKILLIIGVTVVSAFTFMPKKEAVAQQQPVRQSIKRAEEKPPVDATPTKSAVMDTSSVPPHSVVRTKKTTKPVLPPVMIKDTLPPVVKEKETIKTTNEELNLQHISSSISNDGKTKTATTTVVDKNGKSYMINRVNDKVTGLSINGNMIPENEIGKYASLLDQIDRAVEKHKEERAKEKDTRKAAAIRRNDELKERSAERKVSIEENRKQERMAEDDRIKMRQSMKMERKEMDINEKKTENEKRRIAMEKDRQVMEKVKKERLKGIRNNDNNKVFLNGREVIIRQEKNKEVQNYAMEVVNNQLQKMEEQKKDFNRQMHKSGLELRVSTKTMAKAFSLVNANFNSNMQMAAETKKLTLDNAIQSKNDLKVNFEFKCAEPTIGKEPTIAGKAVKKSPPGKQAPPVQLHKTPVPPVYKKVATYERIIIT